VTSGSSSTDEMKHQQEKLRQAELKSAELRNQVQTLKNELKMMQKVSYSLISTLRSVEQKTTHVLAITWLNSIPI